MYNEHKQTHLNFSGIRWIQPDKKSGNSWVCEKKPTRRITDTESRTSIYKQLDGE